MAAPASSAASSASPAQSSASSGAVRSISAAEVARHKSHADCWIIIEGRVFDVTEFLGIHPAGAQIILLHGGRDCTSSFLDVHSASYLSSFLPPSAFVGVLAKDDSTAAKASAAAPAKSASATSVGPPLRRMTGKYYSPDSVLSVKRTVFLPAHEEYRQRFRDFCLEHVLPAYSKWEAAGITDVGLMRRMVDEGFYLRLSIPTRYGGLGFGAEDWRFHAVLTEEIECLGIGGFFLNLGNDMVLSYFTSSATPSQQAYWLTRIVKERLVIAIAMSEPEVGSDLGSLATTAVRTPDGKGWLLNGRKMWISAGATADVVVVSAVSDRSKRSKGITLFAVTKGSEGFECAKRLQKLGKHASDTALLTLEHVFVPNEHVIGVEGEGFKYMMSNLSKERLSIAIGSVAAARRALAVTLNYIHGRQMFGGVEAQLQSVQQKMAQMRLDVQICTTFVDECIAAQTNHTLSAETASMAKVASTELASKVADQCLQFFGGYGYLKNNPVGKIWADQRVTRIYGGANEVLLEVIGKGLGFQPQRLISKL